MDRTFTQIAAGIAGAEGPVFDRQGRFFCVEPNTGKVLRFSEGAFVEYVNTAGIPAGLQVDRDNFIWVADMKLGIFRISPEGTLEHVVKEFDAKPIRGCNDCALDGTGNLYVTAPAGSGEGKPEGEVFCRLASGQVVRIDGGFQFCNGIAVREDDALLIVAETLTKKLWAYDLKKPGVATNKRAFATLPGDHAGGPDGIDYDAAGHLLATNWGGGHIEVFSPDGTLAERIKLPFEKPSNLHLGGDGGKELWITEHTNNGVWKSTWSERGVNRW